MKISVINGPNLNMLGIREPNIYGGDSYETLCRMIKDKAAALGIEAEIYQSNHEGDIVDYIQSCFHKSDAIVINPAAYTHTSVAIRDALKAVSIPAVEVHISDVDSREEFRKISFVRDICEKTICGRGLKGYLDAMEYLASQGRT